MTLTEIKAEIAALFNKAVADLTIDGTDFALVALNQARRSAELAHDFEFNRQLLTLTVDGVTGGDLASAVLYGTATTRVIKTVVDVGQFDDDNNFHPVEWDSAAASSDRQRNFDNRFLFRYPTDGQVLSGAAGPARFIFRNNKIFRWPADTNASDNDYNVGIEAYVMTDDWTSLFTGVTVASSGTPGVDGTYTPIGTFGGKTLYHQAASSKFIYFTDGYWYIREGLELGTGNHYQLNTTSVSPVGTYESQGTYSGTPAVTAGDSASDIWTIQGYEYLLWQSITILNHRFKTFVFRQEGNLPPPRDLAAQALAAFIEWDAAKFDANRRHGRV